MLVINPFLFTTAGGGGGALTFASLGSVHTGTNATTYATTSYTPTSNALVLATVINTLIAGATVPTFAGNGLTWVEVATVTYNAGVNRITLFRAMGSSPSAGVGTASFGGATQNSCSVRVQEFQGAVTTGSGGSGAVVQSGTGAATGTAASVTLSALTVSTNSVFAVAGNLTIPYAGTVEGGWTEDYDGGNSSPNTGMLTMYRLATTDNTPSVTAASMSWAMIAIEIQ